MNYMAFLFLAILEYIDMEDIPMIESIQGRHETVNFKDYHGFKLYLNDEFEDYPNHWHTPVEVILPLQNHYKVICGTNTYDLNEGDILIIAPGTLHQISAPESGLRIIFQVHPSFVNMFNDISSILHLLAPARLITPESAPSIYQQAQQLILEIRDEYLQHPPLCVASTFAKIINFFVLIGRDSLNNSPTFDATSSKQKEYTEKFLNICDYISEHCTEALTLDEIATKAGFSKYHFSRLFKQFANTTFYQFLNEKRISYAESLLINPSLSITEIAYLSGFNSSSSFGRMFKELKSYTPTDFRKRYIES